LVSAERTNTLRPDSPSVPGLRLKLLLGVSLLILVLIVSTLTIVSSAQRSALMNEVEEKFDTIGEYLSLLLQNALMQSDTDTIALILQQDSRMEDVIDITLLDAQLQYVDSSHMGRTDWQEIIRTPEFRARMPIMESWTLSTRLADGRRVMTRVTPVLGAVDPLGVLLINFKQDRVMAEVVRLQRTVLLLGGAGLVAGILLTLLLAGGITGPLERLKEAAVKIGAGEFGRTVVVETRDEIGALAATFNTMSVELKKREEEVKRTERLSAIGTTASVIAHEMKTPLTSVTTYTELLKTNYEDPEFRDKFTDVVAPQVTRLTRLVDDLLDFSRETRLVRSEVDLNFLLHQGMSFFGEMLVHHRVVSFESLDSERLVHADADKLEQVFFNLIKNAIEAQGEGGVLAVATRDEGDDVIALVADTGPGIPVEDAGQVFEPFFTTKSKGTGLGLAITSKIIAAHGGRITLATPLIGTPEPDRTLLRGILADRWSEEQAGTCFIVHLPAAIGQREV
jgi:signal transduction histidine kinase